LMVLMANPSRAANIPTAAGREVGWGAILTSSGVVAIELGHWDDMAASNPGRTLARGAL
jgi:hypothetical protein